MDHKCPKCGGELKCLGGCSAHPDNWYCKDEEGCGWQAWNTPAPKPKQPPLATVTELKEEQRPRCQQLLSQATREFWRGRGRTGNDEGSDTCRNFARYKIGDAYFCRKHAAFYVLDNFDKIAKPVREGQ